MVKGWSQQLQSKLWGVFILCIFCPGLSLLPSSIPLFFPQSFPAAFLCYLKFEMGPYLLSLHLPRVLFLKAKLTFPAAFFKSPFPSWTKKGDPCVLHLCTQQEGVSLWSLSGRSMERSSQILSWFFGAGKTRKEPALSLIVNEDKAFWENMILIFFSFQFQFLIAIFKPREHQCWKGCAHSDRLYDGALQGYSAAQLRGIKELWRLRNHRYAEGNVQSSQKFRWTFVFSFLGGKAQGFCIIGSNSFEVKQGWQSKSTRFVILWKSVHISLLLFDPVDVNPANVHRQDLWGVPSDLWLHKPLRPDFSSSTLSPEHKLQRILYSYMQ